MPSVKLTRKNKSIVVATPYWQVRHNLAKGGCWDSITFTHGSGKNLLDGPVSGRLRILQPHPTGGASSTFFYEEAFEKNPAVSIEETPAGPTVVIEGRFQLDKEPPAGSDVPRELPIRFRRRTTYGDWGLVTVELEIICEQPRRDVIEWVAANLTLRAGMTDTYVRQHPVIAPHADWVGTGVWRKQIESYRATYVPMHMVCFEKGVEGLEFMPASDLDAWDAFADGHAGMGLYGLGPAWDDPAKTSISLAPYCLAYRRNAVEIDGTYRLKYYIALPFVKPAEKVGPKYFQAGTGSQWPSDAELERLARGGVKLVRFHDDYFEGGPFWRDGRYPPYDAAGMAQLRRVIRTSHRLGMKIVPYISVKEFHPEAEGFKANCAAWRKEAGPLFRDLHTWTGSGEFGQLMCLESPWLEFRKKSIDIILGDLPWDGLYFDWCTPHPCRHPAHVGGHIHSDQDAFLDFMFWCRKRVGPNGLIFTHLSGLPQIVIENLSDIELIYEDLFGSTRPQNPEAFPPQCRFMPITPRLLCGWGAPRSPQQRLCLMNTLLEGWPVTANVPEVYDPGSEQVLAEFDLFGGQDLASYKFLPASRWPVATDQETIRASLYYRTDKAMLYVCNLSDKPGRALLKVDLSSYGLKAKNGKLRVTWTSAPGVRKATALSVAAIRTRGIPCGIRPLQSMVYVVEKAP